ncbi:DUF3380 domain-containing protein [Burkholderia stagnalis]|nr:DUF3380 domain-containing protein [Burkholderia stagnalis]RQQ93086.1 DUF3380 domain-containing protein [Burkholderia stagnalis]RQX90446.1 DUF3380 domain-containing protein [Burkholderia stagnalis]RQY78281.1 DUF3380 domain-containing protein [Burkholderia stagnalis]
MDNLELEHQPVTLFIQQTSTPFSDSTYRPIHGFVHKFHTLGHFFDLSVKKREKEAEKKEAEKKAAEAKDAKSTGKTKKKAPPHKKGPPVNPYPSHPDLCWPNGDEYGGGNLHQYEKLLRAAELDFELAIMSCSWGGFQILGEYYSSCGCTTPFEFADRFMSGTDGQMEIFIAFMKNMKRAGVDGLRDHNWEQVATSYNGGGWRKKNPDYANNLKKFHEQFK